MQGMQYVFVSIKLVQLRKYSLSLLTYKNLDYAKGQNYTLHERLKLLFGPRHTHKPVCSLTLASTANHFQV